MNWNKIEFEAPNAKEWSRTVKFYERNGFKQKGVQLRRANTTVNNA